VKKYIVLVCFSLIVLSLTLILLPLSEDYSRIIESCYYYQGDDTFELARANLFVFILQPLLSSTCEEYISLLLVIAVIVRQVLTLGFYRLADAILLILCFWYALDLNQTRALLAFDSALLIYIIKSRGKKTKLVCILVVLAGLVGFVSHNSFLFYLAIFALLATDYPPVEFFSLKMLPIKLMPIILLILSFALPVQDIVSLTSSFGFRYFNSPSPDLALNLFLTVPMALLSTLVISKYDSGIFFSIKSTLISCSLISLAVFLSRLTLVGGFNGLYLGRIMEMISQPAVYIALYTRTKQYRLPSLPHKTCALDIALYAVLMIWAVYVTATGLLKKPIWELLS
jgi:hypothetical protein